MGKKLQTFYKITSRSGSKIKMRLWARESNEFVNENIRTMDLTGYDTSVLRKGVVVLFEGPIGPETLTYNLAISPTKLSKIATPSESKCASKSMPIFEVVKRVGTIIHYRFAGSEHGIELKLDLAGYDYKKLRKGMNFQLEGGKVSAENVRYWPRRGESKQPLLPAIYTPTTNKTAVTRGKVRGATSNGSIYRKYY